MKVHISARGLQEYMAGRLTAGQLKPFIVGDHNPFEGALRKGKTIKAVTFQAKGIDQDDDYLIFEFEDDPAARPLELPSNLAAKD